LICIDKFLWEFLIYCGSLIICHHKSPSSRFLLTFKNLLVERDHIVWISKKNLNNTWHVLNPCAVRRRRDFHYIIAFVHKWSKCFIGNNIFINNVEKKESQEWQEYVSNGLLATILGATLFELLLMGNNCYNWWGYSLVGNLDLVMSWVTKCLRMYVSNGNELGDKMLENACFKDE
jgi:hypothetical protein